MIVRPIYQTILGPTSLPNVNEVNAQAAREHFQNQINREQSIMNLTHPNHVDIINQAAHHLTETLGLPSHVRGRMLIPMPTEADGTRTPISIPDRESDINSSPIHTNPIFSRNNNDDDLSDVFPYTNYPIRVTEVNNEPFRGHDNMLYKHSYLEDEMLPPALTHDHAGQILSVSSRHPPRLASFVDRGASRAQSAQVQTHESLEEFP